MPKSNAIVFVDKDAGRDATEMDLAPATGTDIIGVDVGDGKVEGRGSGKWIGGFTPAALATWGYGTVNNITMVLSPVVRRPITRLYVLAQLVSKHYIFTYTSVS